jgi:hypothetical protein
VVTGLGSDSLNVSKCPEVRHVLNGGGLKKAVTWWNPHVQSKLEKHSVEAPAEAKSVKNGLSGTGRLGGPPKKKKPASCGCFG